MDWNIIGHGTTLDFLSSCLAGRRLAHAYAFVGPPRLGKRTVAERTVRALACADMAPGGCGACQGCSLAEAGNHPDTHAVACQPDASSISIEQVRALEQSLLMTPALGGFRTAVIDQAELLSAEASNSLLKLLEEPPPRTILILVAPSRGMLLPTIASRAQTLTFAPVPADEIARALEKRGHDPATAGQAAAASLGRPGAALDLLASEADRLALEQDATRLHQAMRASMAERMAMAGTMLGTTESRADASRATDRLLALWQQTLRAAMLAGLGAGTTWPQASGGMADTLAPERARALIDAMSGARRRLARHGNPRLILESVLLSL